MRQRPGRADPRRELGDEAPGRHRLRLAQPDALFAIAAGEVGGEDGAPGGTGLDEAYRERGCGLDVDQATTGVDEVERTGHTAVAELVALDTRIDDSLEAVIADAVAGWMLRARGADVTPQGRPAYVLDEGTLVVTIPAPAPGAAPTAPVATGALSS